MSGAEDHAAYAIRSREIGRGAPAIVGGVESVISDDLVGRAYRSRSALRAPWWGGGVFPEVLLVQKIQRANLAEVDGKVGNWAALRGDEHHAAGAEIGVVLVQKTYVVWRKIVHDLTEVAGDFHHALREIVDGIVAGPAGVGISRHEEDRAVRG